MKGTCPMAKIGQHFVGMLWTQKERISGACRYVRHARQIDDSRLLYPQRGPRYAAAVDVAPKIETRVGENEARSLRAVCGQTEESHDADKQQENGEQEIQRPDAGRYDLVHRLHDA